MANTLRFKRGLVAGIPTGVAGEPLFTTDTFDLYIGNGTTNTRFQKYIASGTTAQYLRGDGSLATFPTNIVTGTGVAGQVAYWSGTNTQTGNNNLFWDSSVGRLGVGTNNPAYRFHAISSDATIGAFRNSGAALGQLLVGNTAGDLGIRILASGDGLIFSDTSKYLAFGTNGGTERMRLDASGRLGIGIAPSAATLTVYSTISDAPSTTNKGAFQIAFSTTNGLSFGTYSTSPFANYIQSIAHAQTAGSIYPLSLQPIGGAVLIGFTTSTGESLQVNGTMKVTGATRIEGIATLAAGGILQGIFINQGQAIEFQSAGIARFYNAANSLNASIYYDANGLLFTGAPAVFSSSVTIATNLIINGTSIEQNNASGLTLNASNASGAILFRTAGAERLSISNTGAATFSSSVTATTYYVTPSGSSLVYNVVNSDNTYTGAYVFQAGGGSAGFGGAIVAYGHSHASKAGWITAGISNLSGGKFSVNTQALGGGTDVFTVDTVGAGVFNSTLTTGGNILIGASAGSIGSINFIKTGTSPVASRLTFGTDGTGYSFAIGKNQAGTVTDLFSILDSGAANFTTSIQAGTAIAIGTTPDTNKPFKILKNINATVGINFENTSTGSSAFSAIQMGTDVTGGTKFTNLVYGSSGITQNGVYHPDGTSLINNGGGGLNFLGTPTRFYTGGSNGVVRLYLDNNGLTQLTATTPTTSETDGYRQYSADVVAGNAAPHFRTENGAVIKIYQETTGVGNAIFSAGGGNSVLDDSTFDGYTLRQIVKALRNQGILA